MENLSNDFRSSGRAPLPPVPIFQSTETRDAILIAYDEAMRHWPVPFEERTIPTRYGKTHVVVSGDAALPPLLLLHPAGFGAFIWAAIAGRLCARRRIYALDTIGDAGKSELDDPALYPKRGSDYSGWLDDVQRGLGIESTDLAGGAMGGFIALSHAITAPSRVRRLALIGPLGLQTWLATIGAVVRQTGIGGPTEPLTPELQKWMRLLADCRTRVGQPSHVSTGSLRQLDAPTLLLLGGKDTLVGSAHAAADRAGMHISSVEIAILPNAGHLMIVEEPDEVASRIVRFLDVH